MVRGQQTDSIEDLNELEAHLAGTLKPVTPPREFIQRLRDRINFPQPGEIVSSFRDWRRMILVLGGVMSGLLLVITVARAFFYLVGRRNIG